MYINCVVTLHKKEDLDNFYNEMKDGIILGRNIIPVLTRPLSRNTHYAIDANEIAILQNDPRVAGVYPEKLSEIIELEWEQTGSWSKSADNLATYDNWGIYRSTLDSNVSGWGIDGSISNITETIQITGTGKHVDVIIDDGLINPDHPEFAVNADGSGGTRVNQLNWHTYTSIAQSLDDDAASALTGPYVYTPYIGTGVTSENNHGAHVAGTTAGNTQGWARDANIYNIKYKIIPSSLIKWDYIRAFHKLKPVNSTTGIKNPTIVNCSYGATLYFPSADFGTGSIIAVNYRGTLYTTATTFSSAELTNWGIYMFGETAILKFYDVGVVADIEDAIEDGVIVVGSAGNDYNYYMDKPGGVDYDNYFLATYLGTLYTWYYNRGSAPGAAPGAICVGAISTFQNERKADFSNVGPRIDIWAPGVSIQSSIHTGSTIDPRNPNFRLQKYNGTSMASPQVTGILACLLETYPRMTPAQAKEWIINTAKLNKITSGTGNFDLKNSSNRFLYYDQQRKQEGPLVPFDRMGLRRTSGQVYPRPKIFRYG